MLEDSQDILDELHINLLKEINIGNMIRIQEVIAQAKIEKLDIINYQIDFQPIHKAVWIGNDRILLLLISEGADVSAISNNCMDCLTIAVLRQHKRIVNMLISTVRNPNFVSKRGTALHIAAKYDDIDIMNILLQHPNIDIGIKYKSKTPLSIAGPQTKKLLQQFELQISRISSITSYLTLDHLSQNSLVTNQPQRPPMTCGLVQQYGWLIHKNVFISVDAEYGVLGIFKSREDFPMNPKEIISLESIYRVHITNQLLFQKQGFNYIEIKYQKKEVMYLAMHHYPVAKKWEEVLQQSMAYFKFMCQKCSLYSSEGEITKIQQSTAFNLLQKKMITVEILDQQCINQSEHIKEIQEQTQTKFKPKMDMIQEQSQYEEEQLRFPQKLSDFIVKGCIGKGSFGYVFQVEFNNKFYALKQQDKNRLKLSENLQYALMEVNTLKQVYHPFIENGLMAFQTTLNLYLLVEYCSGGDLAMYMTRGVILDEVVAKFLIAQIILAIEYLHSRNIVYRDLKPENIALAEDGYLKMIDFGLCKFLSSDDVTFTICGSPAYLAPEVLLNQGITFATDIYQIGLLLYEMVYGFPPFYTRDIKVLLESIKKNNVIIPNKNSHEIQDLLLGILQKDPKKRMRLKKIKEHEFFREIDWMKLEHKKYKPPTLKKCFDQSAKANANLIDQDECLENFVEGWDFSRY